MPLSVQSLKGVFFFLSLISEKISSLLISYSNNIDIFPFLIIYIHIYVFFKSLLTCLSYGNGDGKELKNCVLTWGSPKQ